MSTCRIPSRWAFSLGLYVVLSGLGTPRHAAADAVATYRVRFGEGASRLTVLASLPSAGGALRMETTRPAGIPELDSHGWPGLVTSLRVSDAEGRPLEVRRDRTRGWTLDPTDTDRLTVEYVVDLEPLERLGWPAPREAAYRDAASFVLVGRSLFVTTPASAECRVSFELPQGWRATTPWRANGADGKFVAETPDELVENLVVLSRGPVDELAAGGVRLHSIAFGHWQAARDQVKRMLQPVVEHHVRMMGETGRQDYLVVLLPGLERGAESYRASFALNTDQAPGRANAPDWGNLVAHEMFHLWNGWRLHGAEYAESQWFQEGFTEYAANLAIATSDRADADWFRGKLAEHVLNARQLTTTLEDIGTRKGPPLYSAGALVAFTWDVRIRDATGGERDLGDFFRELLRETGGGQRPYAWPDLLAALEATAPGDWEDYYESFIRGDQRPTIDAALAVVGQRLLEDSVSAKIEADPSASEEARRRWAAMLRAR